METRGLVARLRCGARLPEAVPACGFQLESMVLRRRRALTGIRFVVGRLFRACTGPGAPLLGLIGGSIPLANTVSEEGGGLMHRFH